MIGCDTAIQFNVKCMDIIDHFHRVEITKPDLVNIVPALFQEPVVIPFAITHPESRSVEGQQGNNDEVDLLPGDPMWPDERLRERACVPPPSPACAAPHRPGHRVSTGWGLHPNDESRPGGSGSSILIRPRP